MNINKRRQRVCTTLDRVIKGDMTALSARAQYRLYYEYIRIGEEAEIDTAAVAAALLLPSRTAENAAIASRAFKRGFGGLSVDRYGRGGWLWAIARLWEHPRRGALSALLFAHLNTRKAA